MLDRILRRHHEEQIIERIALVADGDLSFLHRLEQCRLDLGGGTIDLVREDQVVEQRALAKLECALLRPVDVGTCQIRGQQVRRELQAVEIAFDTLREYLDGACLGEARRALNQQVPIAQKRDQHAIDQVRLTYDQAAGMRLELLELICDAHQWLPGRYGARHCREDACRGQLVTCNFVHRSVTSVIMFRSQTAAGNKHCREFAEMYLWRR